MTAADDAAASAAASATAAANSLTYVAEIVDDARELVVADGTAATTAVLNQTISERTAAQTARTAAETAQGLAEDARDAATAIVIADEDTAVAAMINTPGSDTEIALSASLEPTNQSVRDVALGAEPEAAWVHYGDSMTAPPSSGAWVEKLQELTGLPAFEGGVGGETTAQIAARVLTDTDNRDRRFTYAMGRNDTINTRPVDEIVADIRASINHLTRRKLGLVFDVAPFVGEGPSATGADLTKRERRLAMDAAFAKAFPAHFVEVYNWIWKNPDEALAASGLSAWTADDLTDIANETVPRSLRIKLATTRDPIHLNGYGGNAVYHRVATVLHERGLIDYEPLPVETFAWDYFNRANGALGSTDDGGKTWAFEGGGTWTIASNAAQVVGDAAFSAAYVTEVTQDVSLTALVNDYTNSVGLYWRGDGTNGYVASAASGTAYAILRKDGASFVTLATSEGVVAPRNNARLWVRTVGNEHRLYVDGVLACTATDATYSGTRYGMWKLGAHTRVFKDFELRSAIGVTPETPTPHVAVKVSHSTSQSLASGSTVTLSFNTEEFDPYALHGAFLSRLVADRAGKWQVNLGVQFASNATGLRQIAVHKNGTAIAYANQPPVNGIVTRSALSTLVDLAEGDYIEATAFQNSGGALNAEGGATATTFSMHYVGL